MLAWAAGKLHNKSGTCRKQFTKPGKRPDGGQWTLYAQTQLENDLNPIRRLATLADAAADNNQEKEEEEEDIEKGVTAAAAGAESPSPECFPMRNRTSVTVVDENNAGGGVAAAAEESNGAQQRLWNKTSVDLGSAMGSGSFETVCAVQVLPDGGDQVLPVVTSYDQVTDGGDFSNQRRLHGYLYSGVEVDVCEGGGEGGETSSSKVHQCQV